MIPTTGPSTQRARAFEAVYDNFLKLGGQAIFAFFQDF